MLKTMTAAVFAGFVGAIAIAGETLPPLDGVTAPQTFEEMWAGFDPRAEPLDVEVLHEWEQDGVILKVLRYRIGIFKGEKAMMAAVYGYPKGGKKLPGLVQIHGGGQYAHYNACLTNAKRGYATISISWGGRIDAPDYRVSPNEVKLYWENKTEDPNYKIITDWGAIDAYHAPQRNTGNINWNSINPTEWSIDAVKSPRNSAWFACTISARRALTFLEQRPEVDGDRLGVYGHSMGGKLTVLTAGSDKRVKAAAPSCGGISDRKEDALERVTIGDDVYLRRINCPIVFLSPANDFHGLINDLPATVTEIKSREWRLTCAAHHNHQDTADYEVASQLWFDQHLKGGFTFPQTPKTELKLETRNGVPAFAVLPDASKPIRSVDVFYTQQGQTDGLKDDRNNTINRFWHHAKAVKKGRAWIAELPLFSADNPVWVYANVVYPLEQPVTGAGYYYGTYTTDRFNLSSLVHIVTAAELKSAGVRATLRPALMIETFDEDWEKEWFTYKPADWARKTHKVYHPQWAAPAGARLLLDVHSKEANKLVIGIDNYAAEVELSGGSGWQTVILAPSGFKDATDACRTDWKGLKELRIGASETLKANGTHRKVGAQWKGPVPEFRNLRWIVE
jgi:dienelactone hydrolase